MTLSYLGSRLTSESPLKPSSEHALRRVAIKVSYDGTEFHGWQRQPDQPQTIQGVLESALHDLLSVETRVDGASRTDAGVHADDQLAAFNLRHPIRLEGLTRALNRRLPSSIATRDPRLVSLDFQPRFANQGKCYRYRIYTGRHRRPLLDRYATWVHYSLEVERIVETLDLLRGERDFASFAATDGQHQSTIRNLFSTAVCVEELTGSSQLFELRFCGTGFMKHMVRNLVGTVIEVARGRWPVSRVSEILEAKDRRVAGPTAAPRGLCLEKMFWAPDQ